MDKKSFPKTSSFKLIEYSTPLRTLVEPDSMYFRVSKDIVPFKKKDGKVKTKKYVI